MATDATLLKDRNQREIQEKLLQYHITPSIARGLAQVELRHWTAARLEAILRKIDNPGPQLRHFPFLSKPQSRTQHGHAPWIRPSPSDIERAAKEGLALCVNASGEWSLRSKNYMAISHVWEEGIQADEGNRGLSRPILDSIFTQLGHLDVSWIWLDCLAIPGGNRSLTAHQEVLKKGVINSLSRIYRNADAVVIFDALVRNLQSCDLLEVAVVLLCGKWITRVWTLQEICLAEEGLVLTKSGSVNFKHIVRALRYLSCNESLQEDIIGPHDPSISKLFRQPPDSLTYDQIYLRLVRLVFNEGKTPSLTALTLSCHDRKTGNDIDFARAFFPLLGLEWKVQFSREEGMDEIYNSQLYYSKRLVLMHGSPRSSFRPGWAPSYLTGLTGSALSPDDPLGDIEWFKRGLGRRWHTCKISGHQESRDENVMILLGENTGGKTMMMACRIDPRESSLSRKGFFDAISQGYAFALSNEELVFPTANGLAITVLLVERDPEVNHNDEAWVYFTSEVLAMDGPAASEVHPWLLLHESPISTHDRSGKAYTRIARMHDYSSGPRDLDSSLMKAIRKGDLEEFHIILNTREDLALRDSHGCSALHIAVLNDQEQMVDALLDLNVKVDAQNSTGRTALNLAAEQGIPGIVEKLLEHGADPNLHPFDEPGSLNQAILKKQHNIIKILLDHGANVSEKDTWGWYPLFHACKDFRAASMLLDAGADPNTDLVGGAQLIHFAARAGETKTIKLLLEHGVEVDRREGGDPNSIQPTALYRAIEEQNEDTVALLIQHGADPNLKFKDSWTCVLLAAKTGNFRILQLVLSQRPYGFTQACDPERWTALHLTAGHRHRIPTKLLLEAGWDYTMVDAEGRTPAALAGENGHRLTMETIRDFHLRALNRIAGLE